MSDPVRLLYYVQRYIGRGPHATTERLAHAIANRSPQEITALFMAGDSGLVVPDAPNIQLCQLPPVRLDHHLRPRTPSGTPVDHAYATARRAIMRTQLHAFKPDIIGVHNLHCRPNSHQITAPYGGRYLLDLAHKMTPPPLRFSSLMETMENYNTPDLNAEKRQKYAHTIKHDLDYMLVRGDDLDLFSASFPDLIDEWRGRLQLTGHVKSTVPHTPIPQHLPDKSIVIAAGGSDFGEKVFTMALDGFAHRHQLPENLRELPWVILVGDFYQGGVHAVRQKACNVLGIHTPETLSQQGIYIEPALPEGAYLDLIEQHAALSVSQAGQSTLSALLNIPIPKIAIPYTENGRNQHGEQYYRALHYHNKNALVMLSEDGHAPGLRLVAAMTAAQKCTPTAGISENGADNMIDTIISLSKKHARTQEHTNRFCFTKRSGFIRR